MEEHGLTFVKLKIRIGSTSLLLGKFISVVASSRRGHISQSNDAIVQELGRNVKRFEVLCGTSSRFCDFT